MTLRSTVHAERIAALDAQRGHAAAKRDEHIANLTERIRDAREAHDRSVSAAEGEAQQTRDRAAAAIARDWIDQTTPLYRQWRQEPARRILTGLASAWASLDSRAQIEIGTQLTPYLIVVPLLDLLVVEWPRAVARFSEDHAGLISLIEPATAFARACLARDAQAQEAALDGLEATLTKVARDCVYDPTPTHRSRFAAMHTAATHADRAAALRACAEAAEAERVAARVQGPTEWVNTQGERRGSFIV